jgi:V-type H+-transporting ATPase proteolipid subunit
MGVVSALIFSSLGASYGMYKSASAIIALGIVKPELVMKSSIPIVMAQVLGIYGIIMAVIIGQKSNPDIIQFRPAITPPALPSRIWLRGFAVALVD